jgi:hypothetical protein
VALMSGFRTETITVLEAVWEPPLLTPNVMTPGAVDVPPKRSEQHNMPGPCGWMIAVAPGMKLLPVIVNVTWPLCCATLTLAIDGVGTSLTSCTVRLALKDGDADCTAPIVTVGGAGRTLGAV